MMRTNVSSSNISTLGYRLGCLYVKFHSGAVYKYEAVPFTVYKALQDADSVGRKFHETVRTAGFKYERVSDETL